MALQSRIFFFWLSAAGIAVCWGESGPSVVIETASTKVSINGIYSPSFATSQFLGIPYAKAERFRHSEPLWLSSHRSNEIDASARGPACSQVCPPDHLECYGAEPSNQSEDCLTLDIYVPRNPDVQPLPVFVFLYGGSFKFGNTRGIYQGEFWAAHSDSILVTVNYRLGMLGFLRYGTSIPGNQGFTDQQNALKWVNRYIEHFGGNPKKVTLLGHSAGAISVSCHLASPSSAQLFNTAIIQSASFGSPRKAIAQSEAIGKLGLENSELVGLCGSSPAASEDQTKYVDCISNEATTSQILRASEIGSNQAMKLDLFFGLHSWDMTIDGILIPMECGQAMAQGKLPNPSVKVIMGSVKAEGVFVRSFAASGFISNPAIFSSLMVLLFGYDAFRLLRHYFPSGVDVMFRVLDFTGLIAAINPDFSAAHSLQDAFGDYIYTCATRYIARSMAASGKNVYLYAQRQGYSWTSFLKDKAACVSGDALCEILMRHCHSDTSVCHVEDMTFQFQRSKLQERGYVFPDREVKAVKELYTHFTNFARHGDPSAGVKWNIYSSSNDNWQLIGGDTISEITRFKANACDIWDTIIPNYDETWQQHKMNEKLTSVLLGKGGLFATPF